MTVSFETLGWLVLASLTAGFVDAIAGGGGLIVLPALLAANLPTQLALGTNKGQSTFGAIESAVSFWRRGAIDRARAPAAFFCALLGALVGASLLLRMRPEPLRPLIIVLLVGAAVFVAVRPTTASNGIRKDARVYALAAMTFVLGVYDGFFGPGVGTMLIVGFTLVYGDAITRASANAKVANLASNIAALAIYSYNDRVLWKVAIPMAAANALGAAIGARTALKRGDRFVRVILLLVVAALVIKLSLDLVH